MVWDLGEALAQTPKPSLENRQQGQPGHVVCMSVTAELEDRESTSTPDVS